MTKKATNHTHRTPSIAIKCQGYKDAKGKKQFAEDHTTVRLVHKQDVHQTTRCEACQKMHSKIASAVTRKRAQERKASERDRAEALTAKNTLKTMKDLLTADQKAQLQSIIDAAK